MAEQSNYRIGLTFWQLIPGSCYRYGRQLGDTLQCALKKGIENVNLDDKGSRQDERCLHLPVVENIYHPWSLWTVF
jgi:hypothetical protein